MKINYFCNIVAKIIYLHTFVINYLIKKYYYKNKCNNYLCEMKFIKITPDKVGASLSFACAIHCAATPLLITFLPMWGLGFLASHEVEWILIGLSIVIAFYVLYKDFKKKHKKYLPSILAAGGFLMIFTGHVFHDLEIIFAVSGGLIITFAYLVNWRMIQKSPNCDCESHT